MPKKLDDEKTLGEGEEEKKKESVSLVMNKAARSFVPKSKQAKPADVKFVWHAPTQELEEYYNIANMRVNCANEEHHMQHIKKFYDKGAPHGQEQRFHNPQHKGRLGNPPGMQGYPLHQPQQNYYPGMHGGQHMGLFSYSEQ